MARKTFVLLDAANRIHAGELEVGPQEVGGSAAGYAVRIKALRGGLGDGLDLVEVDNGRLKFVLLPGRGMGLWKAWCGELEIGWQSPLRGPVHPKFVPLAEPGGLGFLSGFDELLCRCGLESNGAPEFDEQGRLKHPLHGKIANTPAHTVELAVDGETGEISVTGIVDESRLYHNKLRLKSTVTTRVGQPDLLIVDEVSNLSAETGELELLYHVNFGAPLLDAGARVVAPLKTLVPRNARAAEGARQWDVYGPPTPGFTEQVYFCELAADDQGETRVLLRNAHGTQGASLHYNTRQLPCFSLWKSTQALSDGYVTGLEPGVNFPNPKSFELAEGRVVKLKGEARLEFRLGLKVHPDAESVAQAEEEVKRLGQSVTPRIYDRPLAHWTTG